MQLAQFVRALGLLLVLGLAGFVVGCGAGAKQGPTNEESAAQKAIRAEIRNSQKKLLKGAGTPKGGASRRGQSGAKSGP